MKDNKDMDQDNWKLKDIGLAFLFLSFGALLLLLAYLAWGNGYPLILCCLAVPLGSVFMLIGGNGVLKIVRAR